MRVIAGRFRGRRLTAPRGSGTRPTADRVREALFSMLGEIEGASVLDLFAGTGALGIEALSRGAASAVFVERDPAALAALRANLAALGLQTPAEVGSPPARAGRALPVTPTGGSAHATADAEAPQVEVRPQDVLVALGRAAKAGERYHLVFLDPPYSQAASLAPKLSQALLQVLAQGAQVVVESDRRAPLPLGLPVERQRRYRDTSITIHRRHGAT
jgi:16S rRNA (guanine966-N2)-methyltransferase